MSVLKTGTVGQATACATPLVNPTIMPCTHTHWLDLAQQHWACGMMDPACGMMDPACGMMDPVCGMMDPACGFHLVPPSSNISISAWL